MRKLVSFLLALTLIIPATAHAYDVEKQYVVTLTGKETKLPADVKDGDIIPFWFTINVSNHAWSLNACGFELIWGGAKDAVKWDGINTYRHGKLNRIWDTSLLDPTLDRTNNALICVIDMEEEPVQEDGYCADIKIDFEVTNAEKLKKEGFSITVTPFKDDVSVLDLDKNVVFGQEPEGVPLEERNVLFRLASPAFVKGSGTVVKNPVGTKVTTVDANGRELPNEIGGTLAVSPTEQEEGKSVSVKAPASSGYVLSELKYTEDGATSSTPITGGSFIMPGKAVEVEAVFRKEKTYPINVTVGPNGKEAKAQVAGQDVKEAQAGATVVIVGTGETDYVVDKITVDSKEIKGNRFVMPDKAVDVYVTFKKSGGGGGGGGGGGATSTYTLTYQTNGGTAIAAEKVEKDKEVTLSKTTTREGYTFTGWFSDKDLKDKITSIKMDGNKTVYAGWEKSDDKPDDKSGSKGGKNVTPSAFNSEDHVKYVSGYEDGTIRPNANITRAEVSAMVYRLLTEARKSEIHATTNKFTDVTASKWYNVAVSSLANGKYIAGYPDGTFGGEKNITRAEFVTMLVNFLDAPLEGEATFTDVPRTHWAYKNIATAVAAGWISGYEDGTFKPSKELTRAEAISVLNRVLNRNPQSKADMLDATEYKDNIAGRWYYLDILEAATDHEFVRNADGTEKWVD